MATQSSNGPSETRASNTKPIEVFVSYSHHDEKFHDELAKHLKPLEREGVIDHWHDRRITAGKEFEAEIDVILNRAGIILLLVSPDFIASEYCWGKEMKRAMERHEAGEARVIPIILRPVDWHNTPFSKLLALPNDGKAVTSWANQDDALLNIAKGIRAVAADVGIAAQKSRALSLDVRAVAFTTQYRGAIIEVDVGNRSPNAHQITRCSLEIPSLATTLEHSPGPQNLIGGAPWLPRVPIQLEPRKLTRGSLFFSAGMGPLRDGLPTEPILANLKLECFLESMIEKEVEIYTFDTIRKTQAEKEGREILERAAISAAPKEFEMLEELLRMRGDSLNAEHLAEVPILKFEKVNHRLDAGHTYSIELSPYAQMRAFTVIVRVGLHPNASQTHVELPNVKTASVQYLAHIDERGFAWVDEQGAKWSSERIIDVAFDRLTDLLSAEPDFSGGLDNDRY